MERLDVDADERLSAMVHAVERGEEVFLTRNGTVVAEVVQSASTPDITPLEPFDIDKLEALRAQMPPGFRVDDAAALIREMRDGRDFM